MPAGVASTPLPSDLYWTELGDLYDRSVSVCPWILPPFRASSLAVSLDNPPLYLHPSFVLLTLLSRILIESFIVNFTIACFSSFLRKVSRYISCTWNSLLFIVASNVKVFPHRFYCLCDRSFVVLIKIARLIYHPNENCQSCSMMRHKRDRSLVAFEGFPATRGKSSPTLETK